MTRLLLLLLLVFLRQDKNQRIENGEEQEANSEPDSGPVKGKDEIIGNCDFSKRIPSGRRQEERRLRSDGFWSDGSLCGANTG